MASPSAPVHWMRRRASSSLKPKRPGGTGQVDPAAQHRPELARNVGWDPRRGRRRVRLLDLAMSSTSIARIDRRVLELELTEPFGISGGTQARAGIVLVRVELEDGTVGLGEAAPLP